MKTRQFLSLLGAILLTVVFTSTAFGAVTLNSTSGYTSIVQTDTTGFTLNITTGAAITSAGYVKLSFTVTGVGLNVLDGLTATGTFVSAGDGNGLITKLSGTELKIATGALAAQTSKTIIIPKGIVWSAAGAITLQIETMNSSDVQIETGTTVAWITTVDIVDNATEDITNLIVERYTDIQTELIGGGTALVVGDYVDIIFPAGYDISSLDGKTTLVKDATCYSGNISVTGQTARATLSVVITTADNNLLILPHYVKNPEAIGAFVIKYRSYDVSAGYYIEGGDLDVTIVVATDILATISTDEGDANTWPSPDSLAGQELGNDYDFTGTLGNKLADDDYMLITFPAGFKVTDLNGIAWTNFGTPGTFTVPGDGSSNQTVKAPTGAAVAAGAWQLTVSVAENDIFNPFEAGTYTINVATYNDSNQIIETGSETFKILDTLDVVEHIEVDDATAGAANVKITIDLDIETGLPAAAEIEITTTNGINLAAMTATVLEGDFEGAAIGGIGATTAIVDLTDINGMGPGKHTLILPANAAMPAAEGIYPVYVALDVDGDDAVLIDGKGTVTVYEANMAISQTGFSDRQSIMTKYEFTTITTANVVPASGYVKVKFPKGYDASGIDGMTATGTLGGSIAVTNDTVVTVSIASQVAAGAQTLVLPPFVVNPADTATYKIVLEAQDTDGIVTRTAGKDFYAVYEQIIPAPTGLLDIRSVTRTSAQVYETTSMTFTVRPYVNVPVDGFVEFTFPAGFSVSKMDGDSITTGSFKGNVTVIDSIGSSASTVRIQLSAAVTGDGSDKTVVFGSYIDNPSTGGNYTIQARTLDDSYIELERNGSLEVAIIENMGEFRLISITASSYEAGATNVTYTLICSTTVTIDEGDTDSLRVVFPKGYGISGAGKGTNCSFTAGDVNPPKVRSDSMMLSFQAITADITTGLQTLEITGITNPLETGSYSISIQSVDGAADDTYLETTYPFPSLSVTISFTQTVSASFTLDSSVTDLQGQYFNFKFKAAYSPGFSGDEGWTLWMHTDSDLGGIDSSDNAVRIEAGNTTGSGSSSIVTATVAADVRALSDGLTYYIYATLPANQPYGDSTVVAVSSSGFTVRHQPVIDVATKAIEPSAASYPSDYTMNSGSSSPTRTFTIEWKAVDYNNASIDVKLFLSTTDTLGLDQLYTSGSTIDSLENATRIGSDATITKNTTEYTFDILSPDTLSEGSYYVYVTVFDGTNKNIACSGAKLVVTHSPSLVLDNPGKTGATVDNIDSKDQTVFPIYWGTSGAFDIDDATPTISFYLTTKIFTESQYTSLIAHDSTINLMSSGAVSLDQTSVNSVSNSLYTVDLSQLERGTTLPEAGLTYYLQGVIYDGSTYIVSRASTRVRFAYTPKFIFKASFGGSAAKVSGISLGDDRVKLRKGDIFRINFSAYDLDQDQGIRLVACPTSGLDYDDFDPGRGAVGYAFGGGSWLINSTDGTLGLADANVIPVTTNDSTYNWVTGNMNSITDGNYYIYAFVTNDDTPNEWQNDSTESVEAEGTINLSGATGIGTPNDFTISLSPNVLTATEGEIITFKVMVNTGGVTSNEISFFLDIPDSLFTVLDSSDSPVVPNHPFKYTSASFLADVTALKDTMYTNAADTTTRLDFRKYRVAGGETASGDTVAEFKVQAKGNLLIRAVESTVSFVQNESEGRRTQLSDNAVPLPIMLPSPALRVKTLPLGRISGNVPLEGRTDFTVEVTLELRESGSFVPISNTLFSNSNDVNLTTDGVQVNTNSDGYYELVNVPSSTYDLVAKVTNYMTGQARNISIVPGDLEAGKNPIWGDVNEIGGPFNYLELRGGDVSSGNEVGVPDNVVDSDDIQYLQNNFGPVGSPGDLGDVDASGEVDFTDYLIAAGNVGEQGVEPTFNKEAARSNKDAVLKLVGIPSMMTAGAEFEVSILANNVGDLKGYMLTLRYDKDLVELVEGDFITEGDFLYSGDPAARSAMFTIDDRKGLIFVNSLLGKPRAAQGSGELLRIRFRALTDAPHPDITLSDVQLANSAYEITKINAVADVPTDFALMQNYPNPFNPETRIRFQLPEASRVVLKIYNILGQEIRTLMNDQMRAGYHNLIWDGANNFGVKVASGIYIYRIKAGNFKAVKKMVMLK